MAFSSRCQAAAVFLFLLSLLWLVEMRSLENALEFYQSGKKCTIVIAGFETCSDFTNALALAKELESRKSEFFETIKISFETRDQFLSWLRIADGEKPQDEQAKMHTESPFIFELWRKNYIGNHRDFGLYFKHVVEQDASILKAC